MGEEITEEALLQDEAPPPNEAEPRKKEAVAAIIVLSPVLVQPLGGELKEQGIKIRWIDGPCIVLVQYGEGEDQGEWTLSGGDRKTIEAGLESETDALCREVEEETGWQFTGEMIEQAQKMTASHIYRADERGPEAEVSFYLIENPKAPLPPNLLTGGDSDKELARAAVFPLASLYAVLRLDRASFEGSEEFESIYEDIVHGKLSDQLFFWEARSSKEDQEAKSFLYARDVSMFRDVGIEEMKPSLITALRGLAKERPNLLQIPLDIRDFGPAPGKS